MPSTRRPGVDSTLPKVSAPERSSKTAISVKVPPISAARRTPGRAAAARGADSLVIVPVRYTHRHAPRKPMDESCISTGRPGHTKSGLPTWSLDLAEVGWTRLRLPGPIRRSRSIGHGVWVPAFAGTTLRDRVASPGALTDQSTYSQKGAGPNSPKPRCPAAQANGVH